MPIRWTNSVSPNGSHISPVVDMSPATSVPRPASASRTVSYTHLDVYKRQVKDYIKIRYAGTDMLFVPVTQLDLVSKYVGVRCV